MSYYFCLCLLFFVCCVDKHRTNGATQQIVKNQDSVLRANDTTCTTMDKKVGSLIGINFCYIRFGDSSGRSKLNRLYTSEYKSEFYNVEPDEDKNLTYQIIGDTIVIRIYYGTRDRRYLIEPDSIFYRGGIVYLKERYFQKSTITKTHGIALDEVVYRFVMKKSAQPIFRHLWELQNR